MNPKFRSLFLLSIILLSGCAGTGRTVSLQQETSNSDEFSIQEQPELTSEDVMYRLLVAEIAGQRGHFEISLEYLMSTLEQVNDARIAEHATQVAIYTQDYATAYKAAQRWVELAAHDGEAHRAIALLALRQGKYDEVAQNLRRILNQFPEDKQQGFLIVTSLLSRENKDLSGKALQLMRELVAENRESPHAFFAYANLAVLFNEWEIARDALTTTLQMQADHVPALILHARVLKELGESENAIASLAVSVERFPENNHVRLAYARMLLSANRYSEARTQYEVLETRSPKEPDLIYTLALLNLDMDELDKANGYFQRLLKLDNRLSESYYYLGRIAEIRRQNANAIQSYFKVGPGEYRLDAQIRIAQLLGRTERLDDARRHLRVLRTQNTKPSVQLRLYMEEAALLESNGQNKVAIELLSEALVLYPDNIELLYARGLSYEKSGQIGLFEQDMRNLLTQEPENADALNTLGYMLADRTTRYQEAYALIQRAFDIKPDNPAIIDSMGWVLYRLGRHREAIQYLQQALNLQFDTEIAAHLGEVLWVSGERQAAELVLRHALEKEPADKKLLDVMKQLKIGQFPP